MDTYAEDLLADMAALVGGVKFSQGGRAGSSNLISEALLRIHGSAIS